MDPRHAILFEPVRIGPKTLPNRFYQVPHASGFGSHQPRTQAAFRAIKAEGGWGGVCVEYAPVSRDSDEVPAVAADIWDDADAAALALTADEAVFDGHRLAREIDRPDAAVPAPFRREFTDLPGYRQPAGATAIFRTDAAG